MGQKVNPIGFRLGVNKDWESKWYSKENYAENLNKDLKIRKYLKKTLKDASIASVLIERKKNRCDITINTARPGVIIGRGGGSFEDLSCFNDEELAKVKNGETVTIISEPTIRIKNTVTGETLEGTVTEILAACAAAAEQGVKNGDGIRYVENYAKSILTKLKEVQPELLQHAC